MNKQLILLCLAWLWTAIACQPSNKPKTASLQNEGDSTLNWLNTENNYAAPSYKFTFNQVYDNAIKQSNFSKAASALINYGNVLDKLFVPDTFYINKAQDFLQSYSHSLDSLQEVSIQYYIGSQYNFLQKIDSSNYWLHLALVKSNDRKLLQNNGLINVVLYDNLARQGKLDSALSIAFDNVEIFSKIQDTTNLCIVYANISDNFSRQKAYNEAKYYNSKSLDIALTIQDTHRIIETYLNKGLLEIRTSKKDSLFYINTQLQSYLGQWSQKNEYLQYYSYYFAGIAFTETGKLDSAIYYLDKCNANRKNYKDLNIKIICALSQIDRLQDKPIQHIEELLEEKESVINKKNYLYATQLFELLAYNDTKAGNYASAYQLQKQQYQYRDSLWNEEKRGQILELERKYESKKQKQTIQIQEKTIKAKNTMVLFLFCVIGLILFVFLYFRQQLQKKAILKEKNQQQAFSMQLIEKTEEERRRIASDLHDTVNHELISLKKSIENSTEVANKKIDIIIEEVRSISRNLSPVMFENIGLKMSIEDLVERVQYGENFMLSANIQYHQSLSTSQELQVFRIIQESVTNMVKYSKAIAGIITIKDDDQEFFLEIKDNGIGFDVNKILDSNQSFGLLNIRERAKGIGGEAHIQSSPNGTIISVKIKK